MSKAHYTGAAGATCYLVIWNSLDQVYNQATAAFEAYNAAHWTAADYCIAAAAIGAGRYGGV